MKNTQPEIQQPVAATIPVSTPRSLFLDLISLTKPEITFLVTLSALAGFILGSGNSIDGWTLLWALVGIPLVSSGGAALNHYAERDFDAQMKRTLSRPLPAGRISPDQVRFFGYTLIAAGLAILCPLTNPLTGVLASVSVVLYIYIYTPLKRRTSYNTLVGAIPGALPALGGWTAATGHFGAGGWVIFALLVFWQVPHFMALAWMYKKDYERAGYKMWSVGDHEGHRTVGLMIGFSILMIVTSFLPSWLSLTGIIYSLGAGALGLWFTFPIYRFSRSRSVQDARLVLKATVYYIPLLLLLIVADRLIG
jgi:protoheme IX farnesyltransferase